MANNNSKHIINYIKKVFKKSNNKIAFFVIFIIIVFFSILIQNKTKSIYYENTQIVLNNENITANLKENIIFENNHFYICSEDIQNFFDNTLYVDEETGQFITKSDKKLATLKENEDYITINGSTKKVTYPVVEKDGKKYIAISELEDVYDYEFEYIKDTNIIIIDSLNKGKIKAKIKTATSLKEGINGFSKSIVKLSKDSEIVLIEENNDWTKIRTEKGLIGFIKTKKIENKNIIRENFLNTSEIKEKAEYMEFDITNKDISTFKKRKDIINSILQQTIKNDKMYVKLTYSKEKDFEFERFTIEAEPVLKECGINISF